MYLPTLSFLTLSTLATLATSTPAPDSNALPIALPILTPPRPVTPVVAPRPVTSAVAPRISSAVAPRISADDADALILTYIRSTLVDVRKRTANINSTLAGLSKSIIAGKLDPAAKVSSIIVVRAEVQVICYSVLQLNLAVVARWTDSIVNVAAVRQQLGALVSELVWEIMYTLRGAMSRLQTSIWDLLGSQVFVLLTTLAQLFSVLNVSIDGFLKMAVSQLNSQIGVLTGIFSGLMTYAVDILGGLFAQLTKLLLCLLS